MHRTTTSSRLTPTRPDPAALLWNQAERALLLADLYLLPRPDLHDQAIALGTELAELAERLDAAPGRALDHADHAAATLAQAERTLRALAPRG